MESRAARIVGILLVACDAQIASPEAKVSTGLLAKRPTVVMPVVAPPLVPSLVPLVTDAIVKPPAVQISITLPKRTVVHLPEVEKAAVRPPPPKEEKPKDHEMEKVIDDHKIDTKQSVSQLEHQEALMQKLSQATLARLGALAAPEAAANVTLLGLNMTRKTQRVMATKALANMGASAAPYAVALVESLKDWDPDVREAAAKALGDLGPAAEPTANALFDRVKSATEGSPTRMAAAESLAKLGVSSAKRHAQVIDASLRQLGNLREQRIVKEQEAAAQILEKLVAFAEEEEDATKASIERAVRALNEYNARRGLGPRDEHMDAAKRSIDAAISAVFKQAANEDPSDIDSAKVTNLIREEASKTHLPQGLDNIPELQDGHVEGTSQSKLVSPHRAHEGSAVKKDMVKLMVEGKWS